MHFIVIFSILALVTCNEDVANEKIEDIRVDLYYESLCPDSKQFITKQLNPILNTELSKRVKLNIYPYGKSTVSKVGEKHEFVCHHGEFECVGNKYHSCALKLVENGKPTENLSFNQNALKYVNCMMENIYFDDDKKRRAPIEKCKDILGEDGEKVEKCANENQGDEFLADFGQLTDAFQKPLKSVPIVVFNGEYDQKESQEAYLNLLKVLCGKFKEAKPKECLKDAE